MKSNVLFRTAVATAVMAVVGLSQANAGTVTAAARNVAKEAFGTAVTATTPVSTAAAGLTYTFATPGGIVINPGGTIFITLTPTGGKFDQTAALGVQVPTTAGGVLTTSTAAVNLNGEIVVTLTNSGGTNTVLGVGASVTVGGTASNNGNAGVVTVTNALGLATGTAVTAVGKVGVSNGGGELESTSATAATVLTSSQAVVGVAASSAGFTPTPETNKIDLSSTPTAGARLVNNGGTFSQIETLGSVTFTDAATPAFQLSLPNVAVNTASATAFDGTASYDLTLATGSFTTGATYSINSASTCAIGSTIASTQTNTPVAAVSPSTTKVNLTTAAGVRPVTAVPLYLCATYPVGAAIAPNRLSVTGKLNKFSTAYLDVAVAATSLYDLVNNGAVVDMQNYIPLAVTGYQQTVRVINTGGTTAQISVALIDDSTGAVGPSVAIGAPVAAGAAMRLSQATIEAAVGTQPASVRPRLRFTGQTSALKIQSLFNNANGAYTNLSGIEQ